MACGTKISACFKRQLSVPLGISAFGVKSGHGGCSLIGRSDILGLIGCVVMHISTYIFPARAADHHVGSKVFARTKIKATFISVQTAFFGDVVRDDHDHHLICMSHMEVAATPIVPNQSEVRSFTGSDLPLFVYETTSGPSEIVGNLFEL